MEKERLNVVLTIVITPQQPPSCALKKVIKKVIRTSTKLVANGKERAHHRANW